MRKLIFVFVAAGLLTTTALTSCKKENAKAPTTTSTTKNNNSALMRVVDNNFNQAALTGVSKSTQGFLVFTTQDSYDAVLAIIKDFSEEQLNGWEDALAFTSAYTAYAEPTVYNVNPQDNKNQNFEDPLFSRILDVNGLIQIEGFVFKAEIDNGYVLEMAQSHLAANYTSLKNGIFNPSIMNQLDESNVPNNQDVFELLNSGVIGLGKTTGIFNVKSEENFDENDEAGTTWRAACKASYQKAVFFFSLMSEMKYQAKGSGLVWTAKKTDICYVYNPLVGMYSICNYKPKSKSH